MVFRHARVRVCSAITWQLRSLVRVDSFLTSCSYLMSLKPYGCGYEGIAAVRPTKAKDSCINRLEQIDRKIEPVTWSPSRLVIGVDELDCSGDNDSSLISLEELKQLAGEEKEVLMAQSREQGQP